MMRSAWLATLLLLAGCTALTEERLASIEPGRSTREEVRRALGEPTLSSPEMGVYLGSDGREAVVYYDSRGVVTERVWWPTPKEVPPAGGSAMGSRP